MEYYIVFCLSTAFVTVFNIYVPAYRSCKIAPGFITYLTVFVITFALAPVMFWLTIFFPAILKDKLEEQIKNRA